MQYMYLSLS